jgi:Ca2+/H+ antiporter
MPARKLLIPIFLLFLFVNAFAILAAAKLRAWDFDQSVLIIGNLLLFILTLASFFLLRRGLQAESTHAFVRSVYGSFLLKLFVVAVVVFVYLQMNKEKVNKPALFTCMFLYLIYTFFEIGILMKLSRRKKNA